MKITSILLLTLSSVFLISCDSGTPLNNGTDESQLAKALTVPADGDKIIFSNTDSKPEPFLPEVTLASTLTTTPNVNYTYRQVTNQQFGLDVESRNATDLSPAVSNLLGEPTTLSARFRQLIFRDEADFTAEELQEAIDLLNPSGASLIIDPDDPLKILASSERRYLFEIRSNLGDKLRGAMGGHIMHKKTV